MNILGYTIPQELLLFYSCIFCAAGFLFACIALIVSSSTKRRMKRILKDGAGRDITEAIINYYKKCTDIMNDYKKAEDRLARLEVESKCCVKKVGAIRYNAFGGNNSNQSFAAAVLDEENTGFVLNGVYSRQQTATYLKPIQKGRSLFELSEEEQEAIRTAELNYERILNQQYQ
ncbi:MAG: DUF4446 family protein [Ruminococcaceae bacterium]|nr:DUF4446 family protein [Oscillospiraceae bacterium]